MTIAKTLALSIAIFSSVVVANTVTLYDNTEFKGESVKLQVEPNVCKNVDAAFSQRTESADWDLPRGVGGFLSFFEGPDCSGSSSWWSVDTTSFPDDFSKDALANKIGSVKFALPVDANADAAEWADDDGVRGVGDGSAVVVPAPRHLRSIITGDLSFPFSPLAQDHHQATQFQLPNMVIIKTFVLAAAIAVSGVAANYEVTLYDSPGFQGESATISVYERRQLVQPPCLFGALAIDIQPRRSHRLLRAQRLPRSLANLGHRPGELPPTTSPFRKDRQYVTIILSEFF